MRDWFEYFEEQLDHQIVYRYRLSYLILEPRMIGAVAGMTAGLIGGLTFFDDDVEKAEIAEKATTNSAIQLKR